MGVQMTKLHNNKMLKAHETYGDIMPHGLEKYSFAGARILPIYYEIPNGAKVLDCGCNSGEFMKMLKEKKGCDVYGVDVSQKVVDIAKAKGLNVQLAKAEALPFKKGTFDVVTIMETLEHIMVPKKALKEIQRVLKPGGVILGSCPHKNLELEMWDDERLHHRYYDEATLSKELKKVFKRQYLRSLNGAQFSAGFANSGLSDVPCQLMFKAGGKKTQDWDQILKDSKDLRVWMGFTLLSGVVYYRMRGFADKMYKHGVETAYEWFEYDGKEGQLSWQSKTDSRIIQDQYDQLLRVADMSVWQTVSNRGALALILCAKDLFKKPVVMEIDDWLFDLPAYNIASHPFTPNSEFEWVAIEQMKASDAFIVSTHYIEGKLKDMFPDKPIYVIPNSLDFDIWDNLTPTVGKEFDKEDGVIRIGYTGCGNHIGDLELIKMPILKLLEEFPKLELMLPLRYAVGKRTLWEDIEHPRIKFLDRWVPVDKYPAELAAWKIDIGVAPLRDNDFNRAKSNLRWLEYSALKVPSVMSRVYPFRNTVKDGETGLICNSELEWYEALKSLIVDEQKRKTLGNNAYAVVKRDFNMDTTAAKYAAVLKEIKGATPWIEATSRPKPDNSSEMCHTTVGQQPS